MDRPEIRYAKMTNGLILQWQTQPDTVDPEAFLEPMADMITAYLTTGGRAASGPAKETSL
jgi:hypothetical protein